MPQFNPFKNVSSRYGAPMGRHGHSPDAYDGESRLWVRHCGGDGCYDRGGAYWGHSRVYAVWTRGGDFCAYIEARSEEDALRQVRAPIDA